MDPFAQSRGEDDLFSDEFEPIAEPTTTVESFSEPPQLTQPSKAEETIPTGASQQHVSPPKQTDIRRDAQERRPRGGGRGRGVSMQNGLSSSKYAPQPQSESTPTPVSSSTAPEVPLETTNNTSNEEETSEAPGRPGPQQPTTSEQTGRIPAVRGDRSATGGPVHKKLTEEELTAKLEKMAIINAQKSERHRLSEADQAAFQHREKELAAERKVKAVAERKNERAMEMERAKNRERKMKAQGGREWDSEKVEEDIVDRKGRSSEYVRGGHGGVIRGGGLNGSRYATAEGEEESSTPKRGGGFEIRGRGGRGRGGGRGGKAQTQQTVPKPEDFPALAAPSPVVPGGDWAEEMATPIEEKKSDLQ